MIQNTFCYEKEEQEQEGEEEEQDELKLLSQRNCFPSSFVSGARKELKKKD